MNEIPLRDTLTPFGAALAAVLEPRSPVLAVKWRALSAAETVDIMRQVLRRHGLEAAQAFRQADGTMRPTWYEAPAAFIRLWVGSESVIVLKEDAGGPCELRFLRRLATDRVETVMRIGDGPLAHGLRRALWDLGIREWVGALTPTTPAAFVQKLRDLGIALRDRGDGWLEYVDVIRE